MWGWIIGVSFFLVFLFSLKRQRKQTGNLQNQIEDLKKKWEVATQNLRIEEGELETVMSAISDAI
ncbi:MAG: hypothetical protein ACKOA8_05770, partial [Deltaproteobacteria bacterium]